MRAGMCFPSRSQRLLSLRTILSALYARLSIVLRFPDLLSIVFRLLSAVTYALTCRLDSSALHRSFSDRY